ncbi:MAG: cupin domain-containing protein [Peptococcaceae bacterium]
MKKLVCTDEIKAAAEKRQKIFCLAGDTIITPAARDLARELGVELLAASSGAEDHTCEDKAFQKDDQVKKNIDRDLIYQIIKVVLANNLLTSAVPLGSAEPFLADCDPRSGLKIVRGRTVKYKPLDLGDPRTKVTYREVISKDHSQTGAGFLSIEQSGFKRKLGNDEIDIILEGSLSVTVNGETYEACQGDVLFIPQGSQVTRSSSGYVKLFYVKANWADLIMVKQ